MRRKNDGAIYFDACIYLAYYQNETESYGEQRINAIHNRWNENQNGGVTIATSSITICEVIPVLESNGRTASIDDFRNRFKLGLHTLIDLDPEIAEKSALYRSYYAKNPVISPSGQTCSNLQTPDSIHLATAQLYGCSEFWTFDGLNGQPDKNKSVKPLWLINRVATDDLVIVPPSLPQGEFGFQGPAL